MLSKLIAITGSPDGDLLEIGCATRGRGHSEGVHFACPNFHLHGIDYSESGLEMTRQRFANLGIPVTLYCGDALEVSLPKHFEIVLSTGVIEHFVDPEPIIISHARLAKPGGHVIVTVPNCISPIPHTFFSRRFDPDLLSVHNLETMKLTRLREIMLNAGLQDVQVGQSGPPRLHADAGAGKRYGRLYATIARKWNQIVFVLPFPPLWHAHCWAVGRVPSNASYCKVSGKQVQFHGSNSDEC